MVAVGSMVMAGGRAKGLKVEEVQTHLYVAM